MSNKEFLTVMGGKIRAARKAAGISLESMGELTGIDMSNLSFLERGQRNCHILSLKAIADVLGADIKDFL